MQQVAACDYPTVGSGTGIVTAHVPLLVVEDRESGGCAGVFPGEGRFGGGFCGWGVYSPEIAANLAWMRDELFPPLATTHRFTHNFGQAASRALLLGLETRGERGLF